jgi:hypothetical protein
MHSGFVEQSCIASYALDALLDSSNFNENGE